MDFPQDPARSEKLGARSRRRRARQGPNSGPGHAPGACRARPPPGPPHPSCRLRRGSPIVVASLSPRRRWSATRHAPQRRWPPAGRGQRAPPRRLPGRRPPGPGAKRRRSRRLWQMPGSVWPPRQIWRHSSPGYTRWSTARSVTAGGRDHCRCGGVGEAALGLSAFRVPSPSRPLSALSGGSCLVPCRASCSTAARPSSAMTRRPSGRHRLFSAPGRALSTRLGASGMDRSAVRPTQFDPRRRRFSTG